MPIESIESRRYDELCSYVREHARAHGAVILILAGPHGNAFRAQAPLELQARIPRLLRWVADQVERELKNPAGQANA